MKLDLMMVCVGNLSMVNLCSPGIVPGLTMMNLNGKFLHLTIPLDEFNNATVCITVRMESTTVNNCL